MKNCSTGTRVHLLFNRSFLIFRHEKVGGNSFPLPFDDGMMCVPEVTLRQCSLSCCYFLPFQSKGLKYSRPQNNNQHTACDLMTGCRTFSSHSLPLRRWGSHSNMPAYFVCMCKSAAHVPSVTCLLLLSLPSRILFILFSVPASGPS